MWRWDILVFASHYVLYVLRVWDATPRDLKGRQAHPAVRLHDAKPCHAKPWVTCNVASSMRLPQGGRSIALQRWERNSTQLNATLLDIPPDMAPPIAPDRLS